MGWQVRPTVAYSTSTSLLAAAARMVRTQHCSFALLLRIAPSHTPVIWHVAVPVSCSAGELEPTRLARITQAGLLSIRRRSLIPARTHPPTALKTAPRPGVQGGGWLREALVVLRLFHGRVHLGAPTAHPAVPSLILLSVGLAFTLSTSVRPLCVKLRRPRYCIIHPHPRPLRPGLLDRILRPPPRPQ